MIIESYFRSLLRPQLTTLGLNGKQQRLVCDDIHARLSSLMGNWDDVAFRRTALLLGTEDAAFYQPASVDLEIRALVAVGVRNSMLEDLSTDRPFIKAFVPVARCLPDSFVPVITPKSRSPRSLRSAAISEASNDQTHHARFIARKTKEMAALQNPSHAPAVTNAGT